MGYKNDLI